MFMCWLSIYNCACVCACVYVQMDVLVCVHGCMHAAALGSVHVCMLDREASNNHNGIP